MLSSQVVRRGAARHSPAMARPNFTPTARQTNWLIALGLVALGYALYLRYMAIEATSVGLACQTGLQTWLCSTRSLVMTLFNHSVFGWVALATALVNLVRPTLPVFALGLAAAAFGVVLYNVGLAGLAAALLILSLARPGAIESEQD